MALFKEIYCANCNKKTGLFTRTCLGDGNYVCTKCTSSVPDYIVDALHTYDIQEFMNMKRYLEKQSPAYEKLFTPTHSFKNMHLDVNHGLFYISEFQQELYLPLWELKDFSMVFEPEDCKEGILFDKVVGDVKVRILMEEPFFERHKVVAKRIKAAADVKTSFFGNKKTFYAHDPKGMPEFLEAFTNAWVAAREEKLIRIAMDRMSQEAV